MSEWWQKLHDWERPIVIVIMTAAVCLQFIGAWQDSQTTDEAVHLGAGTSALATGDYRLNPEHPPLLKLLAALPVLAVPNFHLPLESFAWQARNQWNFGAELLYGNFLEQTGTQLILLVGRTPMILLWAALGALIFIWSRQRYGPIGGMLSLSFFALDPNWLGHGHLITTDVGVSLFFFATFWGLDRLFRHPSWRWTIVVGIFFAAALLSKFSALLLWFILPIMCMLRLYFQPSRWNWQWFWRLALSILIITPLMTWAVYGFELKSLNQDPRVDRLWDERAAIVAMHQVDEQPPLYRWLIGVTDPDRPSGVWVQEHLDTPIPAYSYWRGVFTIISHHYSGHPAYLFGEGSPSGWWYYFPVAMVFKTPLVMVLLLALAGSLGWLRWQTRRTWSFDLVLLGLPPLLYLLWSLTSRIDIGIRHVFPIYPFLFLYLGSLAKPWPRWQRWRTAIVGLGLLSTIVTVGLAWPHTIGYFNPLAGGPHGGHRYLLDSNIDWNQDIWRLRHFLQEHQFRSYQMALFGSIPRDRLFPEAQPLLTDAEIQAGRKPTGIVVISAGQLWNVDGPFKWLQRYKPTWRVGSSITVYDFR